MTPICIRKMWMTLMTWHMGNSVNAHGNWNGSNTLKVVGLNLPLLSGQNRNALNLDACSRK